MSPTARVDERALRELLLRVGTLNYTWTNTESLLIHLIAGLCRTDKETAIVVFLTLNTTRARLDLVERLAKLPRTPPEERDEILRLTGDLGREATYRNKYNHCIYSFDTEAGSINTILMRIADRKHAISFGRSDPVDENEFMSIDRSVARLQAINRGIWTAIRQFDYPL